MIDFGNPDDWLESNEDFCQENFRLMKELCSEVRHAYDRRTYVSSEETGGEVSTYGQLVYNYLPTFCHWLEEVFGLSIDDQTSITEDPKFFSDFLKVLQVLVNDELVDRQVYLKQIQDALQTSENPLDLWESVVYASITRIFSRNYLAQNSVGELIVSNSSAEPSFIVFIQSLTESRIVDEDTEAKQSLQDTASRLNLLNFLTFVFNRFHIPERELAKCNLEDLGFLLSALTMGHVLQGAKAAYKPILDQASRLSLVSSPIFEPYYTSRKLPVPKIGILKNCETVDKLQKIFIEAYEDYLKVIAK